MHPFFGIIVFLLYVVVAIADLAVAKLSWNRNTEAGRMLCVCMVVAALVSLFFLVSVSSIGEALATGANIACFCLVDIMLAYLLCFFVTIAYGRLDRSKAALRLVQVFVVLSAIDILSLVSNPFFGHVATYTFIDAMHVPHYSFVGHGGYIAHLTLCYTEILAGFIVMLYQAMKMPRMYRGPIVRSIACVLVVVGLSAYYITHYAQDSIDLSILAYSVLGFAMFFNCFVYGNRDALERTAKTVLDSSPQPTVVFDYLGNLFMSNNAAKELFESTSKQQGSCTYDEFIEELGLSGTPNESSEKTRFYWTPAGSSTYSYICDYHEIIDSKSRRVAQTLVFTNNSLSIDQLTGFLTEQYFNMHALELASFGPKPVQLAVFDINQLSLLNNVLGYDKGDEVLALQARVMRETLPEDSLFVRLRDAKLAALCFGVPQNEVKERLTKANQELMARSDFSIRLKADFAVSTLAADEDLTQAARRTVSALKTRKLLDAESRHSNAIESLTQMLAECDGETEGHVQRTRIMGDSLAFELGLSDYERDQLSLLCLFHDIGKVGIPSHILQKPGRLTDDERIIMQEHVQKGYRIARATTGLEIVAEPILHHHENWDGSGYPDGLQHEAIPILSRIIAVVDAYDAMTSDRPYHAGISRDEACREIAHCSGTQFDPYVVDAFVRMMGEPEMREKMSGLDDSAASEEHAAESQASSQAESRQAPPSKTVMLGPVAYSRYLIIGKSMRIDDIDAMFERLTGYTEYDVEHMALTQDDLLFDEDRKAYWDLTTRLIEDQPIIYIEHRIRRKDGTGLYVYCAGTIENTEPERRITVVITDISDSMSTQHQVSLARNRAMMSLRRLEESIQLDPMTGLLNQGAYRKNCERELLDKQKHCAMVMIDVDDFKAFNDTYGHPKGDDLLISIAQALTTSVGDGIVGRVGGDEFSCLLRFAATSSTESMKAGIEAFWERLGEQRDARGISTTFSGGAAWLRSGELDYSTLYSRADKQLYKAKNAGKNQISMSDEE